MWLANQTHSVALPEQTAISSLLKLAHELLVCITYATHILPVSLVTDQFSSRADILSGGVHHTRRSQSTCVLPEFYVKYL